MKTNFVSPPLNLLDILRLLLHLLGLRLRALLLTLADLLVPQGPLALAGGGVLEHPQIFAERQRLANARRSIRYMEGRRHG